jgi:hypothetical protein
MNNDDVKRHYYTLLANGASVEEAYKQIEYLDPVLDEWVYFSANYRTAVIRPGSFADSRQWRIKPATVTHPGGEYPAPLTQLQEGDKFYYPDIWADTLCLEEIYTRHSIALARGFAFATPEDAQAAAKVMFNLEGAK